MSSAAFAYPTKSAEAFRTISEVATELDLPQHVLRFWESRFTQVRPVKRAGGRRYYRPEDIDLLKGIRALLYGDGLTIRGVQKILKEKGLRHVAQIGRGDKTDAEAQEPLVVEKVVYVERPIAAPAKRRSNHLRSVSETMALPFFDDTEIEVKHPQLGPGTEQGEIEKPSSLSGMERKKLEELLDELTALKALLHVARRTQ